MAIVNKTFRIFVSFGPADNENMSGWDCTMPAATISKLHIDAHKVFGQVQNENKWGT